MTLEAPPAALATAPTLYSEWWDLASTIDPMHGRNDLPGILLDLFYGDEFWGRADLLRVALEDAYTMCEFPMLMLDPAEWEELFDEVGYLENADHTTKPETFPPLYRAATEEYAAGMSWTDNREVAEQFLARRPDSKLYMIREPDPLDVLAHFHDPGVGRGEFEYVLRAGCKGVEPCE